MISVGTNHDDTPGPVAIACHTSSGVPGTSTSTWTQRRPEGSFFTLMMMIPRGFSYQLSAISYQLSAFSYQLSAISYQPPWFC
jgi:hypothetical protein